MLHRGLVITAVATVLAGLLSMADVTAWGLGACGAADGPGCGERERVASADLTASEADGVLGASRWTAGETLEGVHQVADGLALRDIPAVDPMCTALSAELDAQIHAPYHESAVGPRLSSRMLTSRSMTCVGSRLACGSAVGAFGRELSSAADACVGAALMSSRNTVVTEVAFEN